MSRFLVWSVALCCAAGIFNASAQNPANPTPAAGSILRNVTAEEIGYSVAHWTVEDGLPQRIITSLAQTSDGYLWCGITVGLLRFDGNRLRLFSSREIPELKDVDILELPCDSAGRLWIGGIGGRIVAHEP